MKNLFTVDLEDWFCSHNLKEVAPFEKWESLQSRVEECTDRLLQLLDRHHTKATFFVLGWIAERFPGLVKVIQEEGHEIASHGYAHRQVTIQQPAAFEADIAKSVSVLRTITGEHPAGYRAPAFSITAQTPWALPILKRQGFLYDSSIYPFSLHPEYGNSAVSLQIHQREGLVEIPMSCAKVGPLRLPCSGGAYLRFYPFPVFKALVKKVNREGRPLVFYIHPWELDPRPPRVPLSFSKSLRHYYNTGNTEKKIDALLGSFEFTSIRDLCFS